MNISRILAAIQRTSHLSNKKMRATYGELYTLKFEERLKELRLNSKLATLSKIAEIKGIACPIKGVSDKIVET